MNSKPRQDKETADGECSKRRDEGSVLQVDEEPVRGHVDAVVRRSVEETVNGLLDAEGDRLCRAGRYERTADWVDTRAGSYERKLQTKPICHIASLLGNGIRPTKATGTWTVASIPKEIVLPL